MIQFPISGVETYWWLPVVVAFGISCLTSMGGISGAFILLPFQVSLLGFASPAVTPTNLIFNIVAIPSGVYRYFRENRMLWPLAWLIILGTLPGLFLGVIVRIKYLPDPESFKLFAGCVLLYVGLRLMLDVTGKCKDHDSRPTTATLSKKTMFAVTPLAFNLKHLAYSFNSRDYHLPTWGILALSLVIGIIGGIYGIGGGAFMAPFLVTVLGLPVYSIAGAALTGTFVTSVFGVLFYLLLAPSFSQSAAAIRPDWILGMMFGIGGAIGMYVGARIQKYMPVRMIKAILAICVVFIASRYILGFFL